MPAVVRTIFDSGTVAMSTSIQPQSEKIVPNHGDIKGFTIQVTNDTTGTLTGAKVLVAALDSIDLFDKDSAPLWSKVRGTDIKTLYLYGNRGKNISETTTSSTSATDLYFIPFRVDGSRQSMRLIVNLAAYSAMATSGATAGNARVIIGAIYDDDASDKRTERLFRVQKSGASGSNSYAPDIVKSRAITATYFKIGTESNLTDVTFSRDGSLELQNFSLNQLKAAENALLESGHQSGIFQLYHSAYRWDAKTVLDFTLGGSDTVDLFFRTEE